MALLGVLLAEAVRLACAELTVTSFYSPLRPSAPLLPISPTLYFLDNLQNSDTQSDSHSKIVRLSDLYRLVLSAVEVAQSK